MIQHHTVNLNDVQLYYAEALGPGPALAIIHGLSGSHAEFLHLVPELARQSHVYLFDLRGHGRSGRTESGYQVADYGRDVAAFLQQVVGQPAILMGHSLGGLVTIWLAAYEPHLLRGIFLEDPALYILQMPRLGQTGFYPYFASLRDYLGHYHANGVSLEKMVAYVGQTPVDGERTVLDVAGPEAVRERAIQLHQMDPAVLEPALEGTLFGDDEPDDLLARIHCPVHLVAAQSALGGAMAARDVQRAVAQIPNCTHTIIGNAGHDIHLDQPEAFMHELKQFLMNIRVTEW
jgi:pimeloyl-ACP methyl ester carboxylesterase